MFATHRLLVCQSILNYFLSDQRIIRVGSADNDDSESQSQRKLHLHRNQRHRQLDQTEAQSTSALWVAVGPICAPPLPPLDSSLIHSLAVPPTILVANKMVIAFVNQTVSLECITESNPLAQHFWVDIYNKRIDSSKTIKYVVTTIPSNVYKVHFRLTIVNTQLEDSGKYVCLSSNPLGSTRSSISLIG